MAVSWVASGTLLGSTGADITPVIPAHVANDILLLQACARSNAVTCATPSGWNLLAGPASGDSATWRTYWFWRRATAPGTTNPLCDWSAVTGEKYSVVHVIRGAAQNGDPFAGHLWDSAGTADPGVATGVTTTDPNQYICSVGMSADNAATAVAITATNPAGPWTPRSYTTIATGADAGCWFSDAVRATAGATGNVSHDFNGAPLAWSVFILAVNEPDREGPSNQYHQLLAH